MAKGVKNDPTGESQDLSPTELFIDSKLLMLIYWCKFLGCISPCNSVDVFIKYIYIYGKLARLWLPKVWYTMGRLYR